MHAFCRPTLTVTAEVNNLGSHATFDENQGSAGGCCTVWNGKFSSSLLLYEECGLSDWRKRIPRFKKEKNSVATGDLSKYRRKPERPIFSTCFLGAAERNITNTIASLNKDCSQYTSHFSYPTGQSVWCRNRAERAFSSALSSFGCLSGMILQLIRLCFAFLLQTAGADLVGVWNSGRFHPGYVLDMTLQRSNRWCPSSPRHYAEEMYCILSPACCLYRLLRAHSTVLNNFYNANPSKMKPKSLGFV